MTSDAELRTLERAAARDPSDERALRTLREARRIRDLDFVLDRPRRDPWAFLRDGRLVLMLGIMRRLDESATLTEADEILRGFDECWGPRLAGRALYRGWWVSPPRAEPRRTRGVPIFNAMLQDLSDLDVVDRAGRSRQRLNHPWLDPLEEARYEAVRIDFESSVRPTQDARRELCRELGQDFETMHRERLRERADEIRLRAELGLPPSEAAQ